MIYARSFVFYFLLAFWTGLIGFLGLLTFLTFRPKIISYVGHVWSLFILWTLKYVCNVQTEISGLENLPPPPFIIASKHQSAWETVFFLKQFIIPSFVIKKELLYIPVYGWYLPAMGMIYIDRDSRSSIKKIKEQAAALLKSKRITIIFPEGTRVSPGETVGYKPGIYMIHKVAPELPIVPVALDSGKVWPKKSWLITPGIIKIKFLPAICSPMSKTELLSRLEHDIEKECAVL